MASLTRKPNCQAHRQLSADEGVYVGDTRDQFGAVDAVCGPAPVDRRPVHSLHLCRVTDIGGGSQNQSVLSDPAREDAQVAEIVLNRAGRQFTFDPARHHEIDVPTPQIGRRYLAVPHAVISQLAEEGEQEIGAPVHRLV